MKTTSYSVSGHLSAPPTWRERQIAKRLAGLYAGRLTVIFSNGERHVFEGRAAGPEADLEIHSPRMVTRLFKAGSIGFAEGYMAGEWRSSDLPRLIYLLHINEQALEPEFSRLQSLYTAVSAIRHRLRKNSRRGARRNIAYHYDLGNDFYAEWLDETWTYSCALFATPNESLADAQRRKYARLLERLAPEPGSHLLEIGCGWGGFALYAVEHADVRVSGITLSEEQLRFARERARERGLSDRVDFSLCDYRDVREQFDHVVSIEMYEAVGEAYWPAYFRTIHDALKPGGRAAVQAITIDPARFAYYRANVDFIQEYVFPGGMLAAPDVLAGCAAEQGMRERERAFFGADYVRTLTHWDRSVRAAKDRIVETRSPSFYRMWRYYLAYCAAGFTSGNIDLMHLMLERPEETTE